MSECVRNCRLCDKFIISNSITFTGGNLVVNLPANAYENCQKYCIVLAQTIPEATTINAPVVFTIGAGTEQYALVNKCCKPVSATSVRTRTRYSTVVETTSTTAIFKMLGNPCCQHNNDLRSVNGTAPVAEAAESEV